MVAELTVCIGFEAMGATKPYKLIWFGDVHTMGAYFAKTGGGSNVRHRDIGTTSRGSESASWKTSRECSAELKGPRAILRIRPEIFDFEPDLGLKLGQTKPKNTRHGTHKPAHNDSG